MAINGLNKITGKILSEAQAKADKILADANLLKVSKATPQPPRTPFQIPQPQQKQEGMENYNAAMQQAMQEAGFVAQQ